MIVDLSKTSVNTMKDVLAMTEAPVIFSHSSAFELCNSSRNVQDEILELVAKNRGLVMVNFYSKFLSCSENSTVYDAIGKLSSLQKPSNQTTASSSQPNVKKLFHALIGRLITIRIWYARVHGNLLYFRCHTISLFP